MDQAGRERAPQMWATIDDGKDVVIGSAEDRHRLMLGTSDNPRTKLGNIVEVANFGPLECGSCVHCLA